MDMSSNSTMDSGMDMSSSCKISMLWNWYTVDSCFLSTSWHNDTTAKFAGSVIGVFLLCMAIEGVRRLGRDYDRRLIAAAKARATGQLSPSSSSEDKVMPPQVLTDFVPPWPQHLFRSIIYGSQFTAAFLVMLLGMYYNGYILFAIFLGQTAGYIAFGRDTCMLPGTDNESGCCC